MSVNYEQFYHGSEVGEELLINGAHYFHLEISNFHYKGEPELLNIVFNTTPSLSQDLIEEIADYAETFVDGILLNNIETVPRFMATVSFVHNKDKNCWEGFFNINFLSNKLLNRNEDYRAMLASGQLRYLPIAIELDLLLGRFSGTIPPHLMAMYFLMGDSKKNYAHDLMPKRS